MLINSVIKTLKFEIFKNILLGTILKSALLFFIVDIIKGFFDFSIAVSVCAAGIYFVVVLLRDVKRANIRVFEEKNPEVSEMLSTAADNMNKDNIVVNELFKEVAEKVSRLSSGSIIAPGAILMLIIALPILSVIDFELSPIRVDALSQDRLMDGVSGLLKLKEKFGKNNSIDAGMIDDNLLDEDIFGERRMAKLGDQDINIKMTLGSQTDLTKPKDEDPTAGNFKDFPEDENIQIINEGQIVNENIEESDLAKKYNEKIRKLG